MVGCAEWLTARRQALGRRGLQWGVGAFAALVLCWGLSSLEGFVGRLPKYDRGLVIEWEALPDWLQTAENGHILDQLVARLGLATHDSQLDPGLAERLGRSLSATEVGWVRRVERVRIRPDGVVAIRCEFRRPVAWVKVGGSCYLVDQDCVRLPGRYRPEDCSGSPLKLIHGVRGRPPEVGQPWAGEDLATGLKVVALIRSAAFRDQISGINVVNCRGRLDQRVPHVELITNRDEARIYWGRAPGEEDGLEILAAQKVALLETLYRQSGRVDMNRAYVNVTTWPDRVALPVVLTAPLASRSLRG